MPELAVIYLAGVLSSFLVTLCHHWLIYRKISSAHWIQLQRNLIRSGCFWSETRGELIRHSEGASEMDLQRLVRQVYLLGGLMAFLAWLGFFLQIVIIISLRFLIRSPLENKLFDSKLVQREFTGQEVRSELLALLVELPQS